MDELRIKVEPYIFPVSQCSRCWKLGHTMKRYPSNKIVCQKCTENHANCNTTTYKCVNCKGQHMSLLRSCPVYVKEKKLRELMSEYNCTYRRALTLYVPVEFSDNETGKPGQEDPLCIPKKSTTTPTNISSYAEVTKKSSVHNDRIKISDKKRVSSSSKKQSPGIKVDFCDPYIPFSSEELPNISVQTNENQEQVRDVKFSELLNRLREILFLKHATIQAKVQSVIKCCLEWIILVVVDNISDWPILKSILHIFGLE